jgi:hypothetical protein
MRLFPSALVVMAFGLMACEPRPPLHWGQGGTRLDIPRARWTRGGHLIDIMNDGRVLIDGEHTFSLDVAGRVFDPEGEPIALLEDDGHIVGKDEAALGRIGIQNAALPGRDVAWLALSDKGEVVLFDNDGDGHPDGGWESCGAAVRTCTLVTHLIALKESLQEQNSPSVSVGIGFGMMVVP